MLKHLKFKLNQIETLAKLTGFKIVENLFDSKNYFMFIMETLSLKIA